MFKQIKVASATLITGLLLFQVSHAQPSLDGKVGAGAVSTGVPFLTISPDARSGGMGDMGIAIKPDANSQYWNIAKVAKNEEKFGASVTYTPWLKDLVPDVFLGYIAGYAKFGDNDNQAISASLRYFNLGNIDYTDIEAQPAGSGNPREFSFDLGYSRELSENLSVGASLRYIHSNIVSGAGSTDIGADSKPANAIAADLGVYYTKTTQQTGEAEGTFNAGAVLTNVGSKITYSEREKDFLPTRLGLGAAYYYKVDRYNEIGFGIDLQKTLAPAPLQRMDPNGDLYWDREYFRDMGVVKGMFESFKNAPKGYGTNIAVGAEYWYQQQFALRAGYYYEHKDNGNRQYLTAGLGIKYNVFGLNFSYLVPAGSGLTRNPLSNTLRFSLTFDFNELGKSEG